MSGLLKFLAVAGLAGVIAWAGYDFFNRPDVQSRLHEAQQSSSSGPVDAMRNVGQSIQSANDRSAQAIRCGAQSDC